MRVATNTLSRQRVDIRSKISREETVMSRDYKQCTHMKNMSAATAYRAGRDRFETRILGIVHAGFVPTKNGDRSWRMEDRPGQSPVGSEQMTEQISTDV